MRAVLITVFAGIRRRKLQTGVFAAGCFLSSFFLLGVFILKFSLQDSFDMAYQKLNAPDLAASIPETEVTEEELEKFLCQLPYIRECRIGKCYLANHVKLLAAEGGQAGQIDGNAEDVLVPVRELDFAFLASSEDVEVGEGEAIINNSVPGIGIGDRIEISVNGNTAVLKVVSLEVDAVNSAPETHLPYFWINKAGLAQLAGDSGKGSFQIEAKSTESEKSGTGEKKAAERFAQDYEAFFGRPLNGDVISYENIRQSYLFRYGLFSQWILYLFLFLFTMFLTMTALLSRMAVREDRKKISILKAVGFTKRRIGQIYIWQYLAIAMLAGGMGVLASGSLFRIWLSGMFANIDRRLFGINRLWQYQFLAFTVISTVLYAAVRFSIREIGKMMPAEGRNESEGKKRRTAMDLFLPAPWFLTCSLALVKCIYRKAESIFLFVLTAGIALLYLISFYIIDGVGKADVHLEDWGIVEMDIYVSRKTDADEGKSGLLAALEQDPAVDFYYAGLSDTVAYRLAGSSLHKSTMGEIYDKEIPSGLAYLFEEGRNPQSYSEAAAGINFARENKLGIGDKITVVRYGEERELVIVGIYPSFKQYGNSIRFLTDDIKRFFGNQADGYYSVVLADGEDADAFAVKMADAFPDFNFYPMKRSTARSVHMLLPPLAMCMGLFALLYFLVLLCMKKIMAMECKEDFRIYRSIGFTRRKAGGIVRWRFAFPVLAGMAVAAPLSVWVAPEILRPLVQQLGLAALPVYPNVWLAGAALLGICVCALASVIWVNTELE